MSLNLLGGYAKNFKISVIENDLLRPTSVMLRRKVFDANQNLDDYEFVDLCSGTGAMGLEALSRGATRAVFIEKNPKFYRTLKENLESFGSKYDVHNFTSTCAEFSDFLKKWQGQYENYSPELKRKVILFFDPPYEQKKLYEELFGLMKSNWFQGQLWLEGDRQKNYQIAEFTNLLTSPRKEFVQGTSYILIFDYRT